MIFVDVIIATALVVLMYTMYKLGYKRGFAKASKLNKEEVNK